MADRPVGRKRHVTGTGKGVARRGGGLGTGPVGTGSGRGGSSGGGSRGPGMRSPLILVIAALIAVFGGVHGFSGSDSATDTQEVQETASSSQQSTGIDLSSLLGQGYYSMTGTSQSWTKREANTGTLDTEVADGSRDKYTVLKGDGSDTVTVMVYMCGADLESKSGMATSDLQEMIAGSPGGNVNIIVYTGGAKTWQNNAVSSSVCQIWKVESGGLRSLVSDDGDRAMTDPDTLTRFIQYCAANYPADRQELIFWDHGGGSVTGYGYDEKHSGNGSMTLSGIQTALQNAGEKFDFVGFDACLMATAENALMLSDYADYLLASEETEPGTGWYYTNWVKDLTANSSMTTLDLGKEIIDDFSAAQKSSYSSGGTTLSLVDLAELSNTLPDKLNQFASGTSELIQNDQYQKVSGARNSTREFARSSRIDQVDLVNLADNLGTDEGKALSEAVLSAVKYNQVTGAMSNAYGLSIYFPSRNLNEVDSATETYEAIGMDDAYTDCVKNFAKMEAAGQAASGASQNPFDMLSGGSYQSVGTELMGQLVQQLLGGDLSSIGLTSGKFLEEATLSDDRAITYLESNAFNASELAWADDGTLSMSESNWEKTAGLEKNLFVDDGAGYIDLGLDNQYSFTDGGALEADTDGSWLAIDDQPVPYYHIDTTDDVTTGRVPVLLNGAYANLIIRFDEDNPDGYVAGAVYDYRDGETETAAKSLAELSDGDTIDFVADYYTYDGTYEDSYLVGDELTVDGSQDALSVSDVIVPEKLSLSYRFTDTYGQIYWAPALSLDNTQ